MDLYDAMRVFTTVVETKSLTQAGRRLNLSPSTVSKHLAALEERFGVTLLARTTRKLAVTEIGQSFYGRCTQILEDIEKAEVELSELRQRPKGSLKVTAPTVFAIRHLSPRLPEFLRQHPDIRLELLLTSDNVDLFQQGIDLAVRVTSVPDPGMAAVRLAPSRRVFCAAPAYLAQHGEPRHPEELQSHNCLIPISQTAARWHYEDGREMVVTVHGNFMANNPELIRHAVLGGLGVAMLPVWLVSEDLRRGALQEILRAFPTPSSAIYALAPDKRFTPLKTRRFTEFLKQIMQPVPPWEQGGEALPQAREERPKGRASTISETHSSASRDPTLTS